MPLTQDQEQVIYQLIDEITRKNMDPTPDLINKLKAHGTSTDFTTFILNNIVPKLSNQELFLLTRNLMLASMDDNNTPMVRGSRLDSCLYVECAKRFNFTNTYSDPDQETPLPMAALNKIVYEYFLKQINHAEDKQNTPKQVEDAAIATMDNRLKAERLTAQSLEIEAAYQQKDIKKQQEMLAKIKHQADLTDPRIRRKFIDPDFQMPNDYQFVEPSPGEARNRIPPLKKMLEIYFRLPEAQQKQLAELTRALSSNENNLSNDLITQMKLESQEHFLTYLTLALSEEQLLKLTNIYMRHHLDNEVQSNILSTEPIKSLYEACADRTGYSALMEHPQMHALNGLVYEFYLKKDPDNQNPATLAAANAINSALPSEKRTTDVSALRSRFIPSEVQVKVKLDMAIKSLTALRDKEVAEKGIFNKSTKDAKIKFLDALIQGLKVNQNPDRKPRDIVMELARQHNMDLVLKGKRVKKELSRLTGMLEGPLLQQLVGKKLSGEQIAQLQTFTDQNTQKNVYTCFSRVQESEEKYKIYSDNANALSKHLAKLNNGEAPEKYEKWLKETMRLCEATKSAMKPIQDYLKTDFYTHEKQMKRDLVAQLKAVDDIIKGVQNRRMTFFDRVQQKAASLAVVFRSQNNRPS